MGYYNKESGYGAALMNYVASEVPTFGRLFVLVNSSDTSVENYDRLQRIFTPDPAGQARLFTSLSSVESAMTSNNNDVCLIDGNSSHTLSAGMALTENRKHFIGMDGGDHLIQQGAKIQTTGNPSTAYLLSNTGTRNTFKNIKFIQNSTDAAALTCVQMGGEGNLYKNCTFTFGVVDNLDGATTYEVVCGEDSGTFIDCEFGTETLLTSAARTVMLIDQVTSSQEMKSCRFKDCTWIISSSNSSAQFISESANSDLLFTNTFRNAVFVASVDSAGGVALTKAVSTANGNNKGTLNFYFPCAFNVTDLATNGTNNDGIQVYGPSFTTATDLVGLAPVAT